MRKKCRPRGPVGNLYETLHLNAAAPDEEKTIYQYNQPPLNIEHAPHQHLNPMVRQMAARNRTIRASGDREETTDVEEIGKEVTAADTKKMSEEDFLILNVHRIGIRVESSGCFPGRAVR